MTKKQEKLYNRVIEHILEEPKRMNMRHWVTDIELVDSDMRPQCNTVACFAGWAYALSQKVEGPELHKVDSWGLEETARVALGLTSVQGATLFYPSAWPYKWRVKLDRQRAGTAKYAKVVADYAKYYLEKIKVGQNDIY